MQLVQIVTVMQVVEVVQVIREIQVTKVIQVIQILRAGTCLGSCSETSRRLQHHQVVRRGMGWDYNLELLIHEECFCCHVEKF